ncbi:hypothetical protein [Fusobacterium sp.]|uniref:hypothetical protein n=1 Tax=Fusobacterium sp. TaxID=68766 RepID=UPI002901103B|nr:hypothetical protein [Fusobacterium sp.]MDU1911579.1 hypothetical protein [Fusobacterium sp.]
MKKLFRILIVLSIALSFISCGKEERYGEEFEIKYIGRRSDGDDDIWYQAEIYPSKYVGTVKEHDKYYRDSGTVNVKKGILGEKLGFVGDTYGIVKINESAEEFYGKKLKELFGENVLQVYDIRFNRVLEDYSFGNIIKVWKEEGVRLTIKGGIYIFGRVENDEDREQYRKQIYEFIQFMKETGTFEYVDLDIEVIDIRRLYDSFNNSDKIKKMLINNRKSWENNEISAKDSDNKRKEILNTLNVLTKNEVTNNINEINRSTINESPFKWSYYTVLLYSKIYSPKYILNNHLDEEKKKEYNKITDIEFDMGGYY